MGQPEQVFFYEETYPNEPYAEPLGLDWTDPRTGAAIDSLERAKELAEQVAAERNTPGNLHANKRGFCQTFYGSRYKADVSVQP